MAGVLFSLAVAGGLIARDDVPTVLYQPSLKLVEGDQPLHTSYVLSITSPSNVTVGSMLTISPVVSVNSAPAGISNAAALSFVSLSQPSITFTGPGQTQNITVTVDVPLGTAAGSYVWAIATPGWATGTLDPLAFINAKVTVPQVPTPPSVSISGPLDATVFNQPSTSLPFGVPVTFTATAPAVSPITSIDADVNGTAITLTATGLGTGSVQATGTASLSAAGIFTIRARATNNAGTSSDTIEVTLNVQPPVPTPDCRVNWLPPISLGKVQQGGSVLPIKFTIDCCCSRCGGNLDNDDCNESHRRGRGNSTCENEHDTSVMIFIYEIKANGATTAPDIFTYSRNGKFSRRDDTYEIDGNHYHLDYGTDEGVHRYHIDVYRQKPGVGTPQLLGTKEFTTK